MNIRFGRLLQISQRNMERNQKRSLAAIFSIAAGFAALNLFEGYITDAYHIFDVTYSQRLMYGDLLVHKKDAFRGGIADDPSEQITAADQVQIDKILSDSNLVENQVRFLNFSGLVTNGTSNVIFVGYGYDIAAGRKMRAPIWDWNTVAGRPLEPNDDQILIGQGLGRILKCTPEKKMPALNPTGGYESKERPFTCQQPLLQLSVTSATGQVNGGSFEVRGIIDAIYREFDMRNIVLPLEKAQALSGSDNITFYSVRAHKNGVVRLRDNLNAAFENAKLPFKATHWKDHPYGEIYVQSMNFLGVFRTFTILVVLSIVTLSVLSTLIRLVQERTREIGTLRSLGFRSSTIFWLFQTEVFLLSMIGNGVGAVFSMALAWLLNRAQILYKVGVLSEEIPFHIQLPFSNFLVSALILTFFACGAGYFATRRALKASIPDCLSQR